MSLEPIGPEHALELYLEHRRNEVAAQTLRSHRSRLQFFVHWCHEQGISNLNELTGRILYEYRIWRRNDGDLNTVSEKTQMATLRAFIRFLESIDAVEPDLHTKIKLPSLADTQSSRSEMLDDEQAEEILSHFSKYQYASLRHVVLALAWRTAMRRGAIHSLDVGDYHPDKQYIVTEHRPETDTPLKNKEAGERHVALSNSMTELIDDWLADQRPNVTDGYGREPLVASDQGRLHPSTIQRIAYEETRPCEYSETCPHGREIETCEATDRESASQCPSSRPPHGIRRGAITHWLSNDVPERVVGDRADVSPDVIKRHYDQRSEHEKMEQRREYLEEF